MPLYHWLLPCRRPSGQLGVPQNFGAHVTAIGGAERGMRGVINQGLSLSVKMGRIRPAGIRRCRRGFAASARLAHNAIIVITNHKCMIRGVTDCMTEQPPVSVALDELHVPHRVFRHPGPVQSLEQAAAERGQRPAQVVRSILFRLGDNRFAMVLIAGPEQVAWKSLRQQLGQSRLTMASDEEVLATTGYPVGAVSPYGLPRPLPIYIDYSVLDEEEISIGSGVRGVTVIMRSADLLRTLPGARVGSFQTAA